MPFLIPLAIAGASGASGLFVGFSASNKLGSALKIMGLVVALFFILRLTGKV